MVVASPFDDFVRRLGSTPGRGVIDMLVLESGRRIVGWEFGACAPRPNDKASTARFKVSRTRFREARKALASKGRLEMRRKTGTRVRDLRHWNRTDLDEMHWYHKTGASRAVLNALRDVERMLEPDAAARAAHFIMLAFGRCGGERRGAYSEFMLRMTEQSIATAI